MSLITPNSLNENLSFIDHGVMTNQSKFEPTSFVNNILVSSYTCVFSSCRRFCWEEAFETGVCNYKVECHCNQAAENQLDWLQEAEWEISSAEQKTDL